MKISSEFSKYAKEYNSYKIIQERVVEKLLSKISTRPQNILDLGCGSGAVCSSIDWQYQNFTGIDFALGMLELHPKSKDIEAIYGDFNDTDLFKNLSKNKYNHVISSSALQWAENLEELMLGMKKLNAPISLAIFTSGTFLTLNQTAGLKPILRTSLETQELVEKHFDFECELVHYKLEFASIREMFRYIKKSGVSASRNVLSYRETKKLMREYPLDYLEFEVIFIHSL